jgi:hypothetical protein
MPPPRPEAGLPTASRPQEQAAPKAADDFAGAVDDLVNAKAKKDKDTASEEALRRAEEALGRLPPLPGMTARGSQAVETLDDAAGLGSAAPVGPGYYAALRGPEGTTANANAVNPTTGASGPYQFLKGTWGDLMNSHPEAGLTWEGYANAKDNMAQHEAAIRLFTDRSMRALVPHLGRLPTQGELYALHHLGQAGAMRLLKNPEGLTEDNVSPEAIAANPWMKKFVGRPAKEMLRQFDRMIG